MAKAKVEDQPSTHTRRGRQPLPVVIDPETGRETKVRPERHPIPDGWLLTADFCVWINYYNYSNATIQTVYSWTRGVAEHEVVTKSGEIKIVPSNGFPCTEHTDGRIIINREEAITWVTLHEEAKASREALKTQRLYGNSTRLNSIAAQLNLSLARQAATLILAA
jgi:hypothetical protein